MGACFGGEVDAKLGSGLAEIISKDRFGSVKTRRLVRRATFQATKAGETFWIGFSACLNVSASTNQFSSRAFVVSGN